jgi:cytochrome b subunit of formate dehydrogenase
MGKKAKINYIVDVMFLIMFVISAVSGFALMRPEEERMMTTTAVIDGNHATISDIHIFSSFLMVAGVIVHLVLHWKWMVTMTRNMAQSQKSKQYVVSST